MAKQYIIDNYFNAEDWLEVLKQQIISYHNLRSPSCNVKNVIELLFQRCTNMSIR